LFGAGILALPNAFKHSGVWLGAIVSILAGIIVYYTLNILLTCHLQAMNHTGRKMRSYGEGFYSEN